VVLASLQQPVNDQLVRRADDTFPLATSGAPNFTELPRFEKTTEELLDIGMRIESAVHGRSGRLYTFCDCSLECRNCQKFSEAAES